MPSAATGTAGRLQRDGRATLAWRRVSGEGPTVVWMGGYRSDMAGTKAEALAAWALDAGRAFLRFDWTGHGESDGVFGTATVTTWRLDALEVLDMLVDGPAVLVGSSMGGWIATLAALARPERTAGLVLVAPAPDFTSALVAPRMTPADRAALAREGVWTDAEGQAYSAALLEDGGRWTLLPGPVDVRAPVRLLQGGRDDAVPWRHALAFAEAFAGEDVVFQPRARRRPPPEPAPGRSPPDRDGLRTLTLVGREATPPPAERRRAADLAIRRPRDVTDRDAR